MKAKRFVAACSLAAVILSATAASAALMHEYPSDHCIVWKHGIDSDDGKITSDYSDSEYKCAATVQNWAGEFIDAYGVDQAIAKVRTAGGPWFQGTWHYENYFFYSKGKK